MFCVYILQSEAHPDETQIVSTHDQRPRLTQHNSGRKIRSNKFKPRSFVAYIGFFGPSVDFLRLDDRGAASNIWANATAQ